MLSSLKATDRLVLRQEAADGSDADFLFGLFASVKAAEMAQMPIDVAGRDFLLHMQFRSMMASYRAMFPAARFEIVERDGAPIGRLVTDVTEERVYFVDFALLPEYRGRGFGKALITAALDEPRRLGLPCRMQVMVDNIACIRLFAGLGFTLRAEIPPQFELEWRPEAVAS